MIKEFLKNKSGNFATIFAVASLPVMLGIGAAVDYTGVSQDQTKLQNAVDSAILAVGEDFEEKKKSEIRTELKAYLKSNLTKADFRQISKLIIDVDRKNHKLTVTAKANSPTSFMMLAGVDALPYDAIAQIKSSGGGAEIVFVLDNTGSMDLDGKLDSLKSAATEFTNTIMKKDTGGDIKIGIVPFSNYVNVGMTNRNASWLDVAADSSTTDPNYCSMTSDLISETNCRTVNGTNSEGQSYSYEQCDRTYGEPYEVCGPHTTSETWYGCVGSRPKPLNLEDRSYATRVPGLMNISCGAPITPLTDVKSSVLSQITAMTASGNTYIPTGLTWGMRVISSGAPFSEAVSNIQAKKQDIKKFIILMTDGDNTASADLPDNPTHWGSDAEQSDKWTAKVCKNIKKSKVSVFSITFGTITNDTKELIRNCASSESQYFHAATGNELKEVFSDIQGQISALHLSM